MVEVLLILLVILQFVGLITAWILIPRWIASKEKQLQDQLRAFVEAKEGEASPLAVLTDQVATLFAGRLWQQVEARLRGAAGAMGREASQQAEAEVAGSGPLAALAMAFLPKKAKMMLVKNPQFLGALAGLVPGNRKTSGSSGDNAGQNMRMEL